MHPVRFLASYPKARLCPASGLPEHALIGRSNVGKSSLINYLFNHKSLAKTSSRPGKTTMLCHFSVQNSWLLMDMPGYGWANTSKETRTRMQKENLNYLKYRKNLACLWLLIDSQHPLQPADKTFLSTLRQHPLPFVVVLTKTDKLTLYRMKQQKAYFLGAFKEMYDPPPAFFFTSAKKKRGRQSLLDMVEKANQHFLNP